MPKRIAIVGGGIAGLTAAWQLHRLGHACTLFEASGRLGGIVETVRRDGFVVETGPDGWVTEKPWAHELAHDLGLADDLIHSNDATRVTYIVQQGRLVPLPDGLRMMVPTDLAALEGSPLFSPEARAAYGAEPGRADELRAAAPDHDESIASFVERHFGAEVLAKVGAPLLSGVFGGDVHTLSVRAVMPRFVHLEREYGSLTKGLQATAPKGLARPIFTSLRHGTGSLAERMAAELPAESVALLTPVRHLQRVANGWMLRADGPLNRRGARDFFFFDEVVLATAPDVTTHLLAPEELTADLSAELAGVCAGVRKIEASSCIIAALAFRQSLTLPAGFGFLVPAGAQSTLMAATFVEGKYPHRVPPGAHLLRAFFGGASAARLAGSDDDAIAREAHEQLSTLLAPHTGPLPQPAFAVVRRWPRSLPQYAVGHGERMAALRAELECCPGLHLLGNGYHGVGLPDLVRDARALARWLARHN